MGKLNIKLIALVASIVFALVTPGIIYHIQSTTEKYDTLEDLYEDVIMPDGSLPKTHSDYDKIQQASDNKNYKDFTDGVINRAITSTNFTKSAKFELENTISFDDEIAIRVTINGTLGNEYACGLLAIDSYDKNNYAIISEKQYQFYWQNIDNKSQLYIKHNDRWGLYEINTDNSVSFIDFNKMFDSLKEHQFDTFPYLSWSRENHVLNTNESFSPKGMLSTANQHIYIPNDHVAFSFNGETKQLEIINLSTRYIDVSSVLSNKELLTDEFLVYVCENFETINVSTYITFTSWNEQQIYQKGYVSSEVTEIQNINFVYDDIINHIEEMKHQQSTTD